ncbi:galactose mutarotase-like protein [Punctularia strigosozonata HHB-11173 SS5]|uniref:galactose mutarotase-like protein n=1 Tax=Punctularia strigosozonata (strain HHB-11173) TaxID=741275 RepID=UPI000441710A|nr:galactose mutarotase-like protein [Punctularia strigosozonata HHB-11173 SS5]EIN10310.1 galactose mutarotase-like protein [Punctularia strigosozonata HHB-11173 SS5]
MVMFASLARCFVACASLATVVGALSLRQRGGTANVSPLEAVKISSPDGSAYANFIPYGAIVTNFFVKDKHGKFRDIILGYDNHTNYLTDALGHPYFGPIVGRYANRIKNGTFSIPPTRSTPSSGPGVFHIVENENGGKDTLHGGSDGFDRRVWTVSKQTAHSVTFTVLDPDGMQGFPGTVHATVTYTLENHATWNIKIHATADKLTPIMLSGHHYWNLEAFEESADLDAHFAQFPSSRVVGTDGILIPTGELLEVEGTPLDFRKAKSIGAAINQTAGLDYCGTGCVGFDNCWVYDEHDEKKPVFSLWSTNSGIRLDVTTNQPALQVYTCDGIFNASLPIPRKADQGGPSEFYTDHSCLVVEQESWIDAINQPEWGIDQIYGPKRDYNWESTYAFSVIH